MDKEDIRRCIDIIESSRRWRVTKRPAAEGGPATLPSRKSTTQSRSRDGSDGTHAAARGHENASGSGGSDSEASDRIVYSETPDTPWPYMDPKQQAATLKERTDDARRRYFMGVAKDEEQYLQLLLAAGIERNPKTEHLCHKGWDTKYWSSDEENLAEDLNAEPSDTDSFIRIPEDTQGKKL